MHLTSLRTRTIFPPVPEATHSIQHSPFVFSDAAPLLVSMFLAKVSCYYTFRQNLRITIFFYWKYNELLNIKLWCIVCIRKLHISIRSLWNITQKYAELILSVLIFYGHGTSGGLILCTTTENTVVCQIYLFIFHDNAPLQTSNRSPCTKRRVFDALS